MVSEKIKYGDVTTGAVDLQLLHKENIIDQNLMEKVVRLSKDF